jgi:hydroxyacyl-ACP dehydratase HTD2-like protein with hotdog domain
MAGLLSPELLAHIGRTSAPRLELVTRKDIRKYSIATSQRERRYLDGDEAPPMFYLALFWQVPSMDELSPDGVAVDPLLPEFPLKRAMAGGLHIDYHRPIRPGDVLMATRELSAIYEKQGSSGPLIFYEILMRVLDESGQPVVTEKTTRILR